MNFSKNAVKSGQNGNAMIYVLLALALIGLLTATIMRQDDNASSDISADQIEFQAMEILAYSAAAQSALDQMTLSGTNPDNIDFTMPSATSFNTAPYLNKFFHPQGGGMNFKLGTEPLFDLASGPVNPLPGFYVTRPNNIEWTPTTADDIVAVAYYISKPVCESINKKITGSTAIPSIADPPRNKFIRGPTVGFAYANSTFSKTDCPDCEGYPALCISRGSSAYTYYSIISGR